MSDADEHESTKAAVLAYVEEHDWVTFARLHKHFAADSRDDTEIALPGNRVIWSGLPRIWIDAVLALLDEGRLGAIPASKAAYKHDGRILKLPVERHPSHAPHDHPHWFPVFLRPMTAILAEASAPPEGAPDDGEAPEPA